MYTRYFKESTEILYHGTSKKIKQDILNSGFKLTTGKRSGTFGAVREVENLGIFLTNSRELAWGFAENRFDRQDSAIIKVQVNTSNFLNMMSWNKTIDKDIKKKGQELILAYYGVKKTKPGVEQYWWLLDQKDFVNLIKQKGFDGVIIEESKTVKRNLGVSGQDIKTYFVIDPKLIKIVE